MPVVRISPRHAPLWRSVRELQFGVADGPVLDSPSPWQERAVAELERGVEAAGIASLAADPAVLSDRACGPVDGVAALVRALAPVLEVVAPATPGVAIRSADAVPDRVVATLIDALTDEGWPAVWLAPGVEAADRATPTLLVAANAMPPHLGTRCMTDDAPHLPLVFASGGAEVGPVVRPGLTACLACLDAHRTDADPAWPVIVSQLLLRPAPSVSLPLAVEAAVIAAELLDEAFAPSPVPAADPGAARVPTEPRRSAAIDAGERGSSRGVTWRTHRRHPECLCALELGRPVTLRAA